jgi:hypothetical protein
MSGYMRGRCRYLCGWWMSEPYKGFRDRDAHDRAHELLRLPSWHPDAPPARTRRVIRDALRLCLHSPGYCDYDEVSNRFGRPLR